MICNRNVMLSIGAACLFAVQLCSAEDFTLVNKTDHVINVSATTSIKYTDITMVEFGQQVQPGAKFEVSYRPDRATLSISVYGLKGVNNLSLPVDRPGTYEITIEANVLKATKKNS